MAPCCILIAHAFGRVGCFFAGCCYGKETDSFLGVKFPNLPNPVHPTQLYEAAFLFLLFAICFILLMKKDFKHNLTVYLIAYGIFRFFIEYLRADDRGEFIPGISPSQFWSILMVVIGVGLIFLMRWLFQKRDAELALEAEQAKLEAVKAEEKAKEEGEKPAHEIVWKETETAETKPAETVTEPYVRYRMDVRALRICC